MREISADRDDRRSVPEQPLIGGDSGARRRNLPLRRAAAPCRRAAMRTLSPVNHPVATGVCVCDMPLPRLWI
ncbi:hypothetical protein GCM10018966_025030 [Streptomyces yanii]